MQMLLFNYWNIFLTIWNSGSDSPDEDEGIFPAISRSGKSRKKVGDIELEKLKQRNSKKLRFNGLDGNQVRDL